MPMYRTRPSATNLDGFNEGLSALGKAFAPPTPQEIAVSQKAAADARKAAAVQRIRDGSGNVGDFTDAAVSDPARQAVIADMYYRSKQPGAKPSDFDNGSYIVNGNAGNTFAGLGINNAAQMERTKVEQRGQIERAMLAPIPAGGTRFTPKTIGDAFGGVPEVQTGVVDVSPGNRATLADGRVIEGAPKPMNMDETRALILRGLPENERRVSALHDVPTENVVGADGRPQVAFRPDAVGQQPASDAAAKPDLRNYKDGDRAGAARFDPSQGWVDAQTGQKLSPNVQLYSSQLQGNAADTGLGSTAKNGVEQQLLDAASVEQTGKALRALIDKDPGAQGIIGSVMGLGQDVVSVGKEGAKLFGPVFSQTQKDIASGLVDPDIAAQMQTYNPNIPQIKLQEMLLAGQVAKMIDPNGRISNDRMKQVTESLGGGGFLSNANRTRATLDAIQNMVDNRRRMLGGVAPEAAAVGRNQEPTPPVNTKAPTAGFAEGTIIENDAGQRMIRRGGKWEPSNG